MGQHIYKARNPQGNTTSMETIQSGNSCNNKENDNAYFHRESKEFLPKECFCLVC
ncbi:hypothetical protein FRACYDRAFT_221002 [Fragilariopsis cylindrus CCMP1102]|uniref:Uncharacterized protein n=1 Tax=Fragilariopsis cylindrus CCMP1102 TaxID=635003 RepID=A0A1E7EQK2_9STRA|nr:hypothetical protein FRACYDRAFT_221002 [Fragilariopsis cylindrus CCMP1102]|eukprot:OEU08248.1 hypothetical protein FRACYDRAFT_221002 [Fragilariopsis cylindrus CCMP1102]